MTATSLLALLPFGFMYLDTLRSQVGVEDFHREGIKGKGVIIGLNEQVDLTLWDFRNPDGSTRFLRHYDRSREEIDSLLRIHYPENRLYPFVEPRGDTLLFHNSWSYHGTSVLSIAAGNGQSKGAVDLSGKYLGLAPEADLVVGDYESVRDLADSLGRPFVFNHSFQSNINLDPRESTVGRIAVLSAGNSHVIAGRHRFAPGDTHGATFHFRPSNRDFHKVGDSTYLFDVLFRIWYPDTSDQRLDITLHSPNDTILRYRVDLANKSPIHDTVRGEDSEDQYLTCSGDTLAPLEAVHIEWQDSFRWVDAGSTYGLRYRVRTRAFKDFTITLNRVDFRGSEELVLPAEVISYSCMRYIQAEEFRDTLKGTMTLLATHRWEGGLTDLQGIHVGSYARNVNHGFPQFDPLHQKVGDVAYYSGRGDFRTFGVVKPDIAAPAHNIMALGYAGPGERSPRKPDSLHAPFDGTSAAAPVVTGAVALLLQMDPTLDDAEIKAILRENALTDSFTGAVPNDNFGYGKFHLDWDKVRTRIGYVGTKRPAGRGNLKVRGPFPNPFRSRLRVEYASATPDPQAFLEIRDLRGKLVYRSAPGDRQGLVSWDIDASTWPGGIYPYRLHTRQGDRQGRLLRED